MYRFFYYQNNLPDFYCDYFKQNSELHNYNTRNPPSYTGTFKELIIANILCLINKGSLYGMVSMKIPKISNRISLLRKK